MGGGGYNGKDPNRYKLILISVESESKRLRSREIECNRV